MREAFLATVLRSRTVACDIHELVIAGHKQMQRARAGQFVHLAATDALDPLLRRPMSIAGMCADGTWQVIFKVKGMGTKALASLQTGDNIDVLGPLGNGFQLPGPAEQPLLVGGGLGVAPLLFLAQTLCQKGWKPRVLLGFASGDESICLPQFSDLTLDVDVATDDGSLGKSGLVTDLLPDEKWGPVYTCGPVAMMSAVVNWCKEHDLECQVSLEERMACGVGACLSCVCPIRLADGTGWQWQRACKEGPVFDGLEVAFDVLGASV